MPTKQVNYRNDKAVLMKVYVEKPKKKRSSSIQHHHHHHHYHVHHMVTQVHGLGSSKGYDRRSRLLMYSRILRNSARGGASLVPLLPNYSENNNNMNIQTPTKINSSKKKPKHGGTPSSFGNWKLLIPSFLRSWSNEQKKEKKKKQNNSVNGYKKLQVSKGKGFISKVLSICKCA